MYAPVAKGATLASTGAAAVLTQNLWVGLAVVVVGGALISAARFGPRIAIEPVRRRGGRYSLRLTINGKPWRVKRR